ncbi:MAG: HAD-IIA family hydrolase [Actinomycetota bacterium]|nr:HAD-IIA family hydrolase [Actinomycetota bacterium]
MLGEIAGRYSNFLVDLDGVVYLLNTEIEGSVNAINELLTNSKSVFFLTNNSVSTPGQYVEKLESFGIEINQEQVVTSSIALRNMIQKNFDISGKKVFVIGEEGLLREFELLGLEIVDKGNADIVDFVVVGLDRSFDFEKLRAAAMGIRSGAFFLATNTDSTFPTPLGLMPGAGSLVAAVACASGVEPLVAGKPNPLMVNIALERAGGNARDTLLIGDRLETDIIAGERAGVDTLLVLSGVSKFEDIEKTGMHPTYVSSSIADFLSSR